MTPSVRLDAELDSDQRREALAFHKDLFTSDNGNLGHVFYLVIMLLYVCVVMAGAQHRLKLALIVSD